RQRGRTTWCNRDTVQFFRGPRAELAGSDALLLRAKHQGRANIRIVQDSSKVLTSAMPVHDWNRVTAGTFHDFHLAWIAELRRTLNGGLLPQGYYALAEQVAGEIIPDVLTLQQGTSQSATAEFKEEFASCAGAAVLPWS